MGGKAHWDSGKTVMLDEVIFKIADIKVKSH